MKAPGNADSLQRKHCLINVPTPGCAQSIYCIKLFFFWETKRFRFFSEKISSFVHKEPLWINMQRFKNLSSFVGVLKSTGHREYEDRGSVKVLFSQKMDVGVMRMNRWNLGEFKCAKNPPTNSNDKDDLRFIVCQSFRLWDQNLISHPLPIYTLPIKRV